MESGIHFIKNSWAILPKFMDQLDLMGRGLLSLYLGQIIDT